MGGINIEDKELYRDYKNFKWCDYMVEFADADIVRNFKAKLKAPESVTGNSGVDFYFNIQARNVYQIKPRLFQLMAEAKECLDIEMAYFGDPDVTKRIIECANKGIKVSIIFSKEANIQNSLNQKVMNEIFAQTKGKVEIFISDRVVHSKFICVDNCTMFFGSANYNKKGMIELSELNVMIENAPELIQSWKKWRKEHIAMECQKYSGEKKLAYNKVYALVESVLC
jgi:cardiolipin synthase